MKVMVLVKASASSEAGVMPGEALLTAMGQYNEELVKAGVMLAGEGLKPSARGIRVHFSGLKRTVTDGPFAETKEQLGGFCVVEASDMNHAIELLSKHPAVRFATFEIRPADEQINALVGERHQRLEEKTKRQSRSKA